MRDWIIGLLSGPIVSRVAGVLAAGATDFIVNNAHLQVDAAFSDTLKTVLVMLAYALTHKAVSEKATEAAK